jgi:hypothetical protein
MSRSRQRSRFRFLPSFAVNSIPCRHARRRKSGLPPIWGRKNRSENGFRFPDRRGRTKSQVRLLVCGLLTPRPRRDALGREGQLLRLVVHIGAHSERGIGVPEPRRNYCHRHVVLQVRERAAGVPALVAVPSPPSSHPRRGVAHACGRNRRPRWMLDPR